MTEERKEQNRAEETEEIAIKMGEIFREALQNDKKFIIFTGGRGCTKGLASQLIIIDANEMMQRKSILEEAARKQEEARQQAIVPTYEDLISLTSTAQNALYESFEKIAEALQNGSLKLPSLSLSDTSEPFHREESIDSLKKRLKYSKNPMERKQLQKELNSAYKARRK